MPPPRCACSRTSTRSTRRCRWWCARDERDLARLTAAGASEVVPEAFESGVMLASHTLVLVGVPLSRVMRRMSLVRGEQYGLLRGLFQGGSEDGEEGVRLHSITLDAGAHALG